MGAGKPRERGDDVSFKLVSTSIVLLSSKRTSIIQHNHDDERVDGYSGLVVVGVTCQ
jgi:hypothetical protein